MGRGLRRISVSGYYHLISRGNNKQILYESPDDYRYYLSKMGKYSREADVVINAFCLMENHVHILVNDPHGNVSAMMRNLNGCYSKYYNQKYGRIGQLYQGRFLSEPIETETALFIVFRYILNNPRKAGICPASQYRWSSYKAYFGNYPSIDLSFVRDRLPTAESYRQYIDTPNEDECLEYENFTNQDDYALDVIRSTLEIKTGTELQSWEKSRRNEALRALKAKGLSIRRLERLTGVGRYIISHA